MVRDTEGRIPCDRSDEEKKKAYYGGGSVYADIWRSAGTGYDF